MSQLPLTPDAYADGNSQGCRFIHTVMSVQNLEEHCAHIAINPTMDPSGLFKCQNSAFMQPKGFSRMMNFLLLINMQSLKELIHLLGSFLYNCVYYSLFQELVFSLIFYVREVT